MLARAVLALCTVFASPSITAAAAALRVAVAEDGSSPAVCAALLRALKTAGMDATPLGNAALAKLSAESYDAVVLPNAPALPAGAAPAYFAFAKAGGHIVVLGGRPPRLNVTAEFASINLMDTYEPYRLRNAVSVQPLDAAAAIAGRAPPPPFTGTVNGLSAVGFARQGQSAFVPLLHAVDKHNRSAGWALSAMVTFRPNTYLVPCLSCLYTAAPVPCRPCCAVA